MKIGSYGIVIQIGPSVDAFNDVQAHKTFAICKLQPGIAVGIYCETRGRNNGTASQFFRNRVLDAGTGSYICHR